MSDEQREGLFENIIELYTIGADIQQCRCDLSKRLDSIVAVLDSLEQQNSFFKIHSK